MEINTQLAKKLEVQDWQVGAAVTLIDEGNTIPFISLYRKEANGYMNEEALRKLPAEFRQAYEMNRSLQMTHKEIAEKLAVSEQTVKNQLTELLKRLRKEMNNKNFIFWFSIFS